MREDEPIFGYYWYNFVNETRYSIEVTLNHGYYRTSPFSLSPSSNQRVNVDTGSVEFSWTASSGGNNRYIYTAVAGSQVTFKER
jgi:hypothetical protein